MRLGIYKFLPILMLLLSINTYGEEVNLKELVDADNLSNELVDDNRRTRHQDNGESPLSTLIQLRRATIEKNWDKAAEFIDLRNLPEDVLAIGGPELIRRLAIVFNQQNVINLSSVSEDEKGHQNDGLPSYRDQLGVLKTLAGDDVPIYLQRIPDGKGGRVWRISNSTLSAVPALWDDYGYPEKIESIASHLPSFSILHMENWQFIGFVILVIGVSGAVYIATWLIALPFRRLSNGPIYIRFITRGLRVFVIFKLINAGVMLLGLSLKARVWFASGLFDYIALFFIVLGLIEIFTSLYLQRPHIKKSSAAIIRPLATTIKIFVGLTIILAWLDSAGFNIGTIIAGLGIGSLAIALAAQKTLENVFGAFTMYIARPIVPGNFCRFGDIEGTVEEIGLRSTRIRTLDRRIVHVPNSEFSSKNLENFAEIDRRHYKKLLRLSLDTSPDELRKIVVDLKTMLFSHEKVMTEARRVRFEDIAPDAYIICINAYVSVTSVVEFKAIAEDINFHIVDILHRNNITLLPPHQHISFESKSSSNSEFAELARSEVEALKQENNLPIPNFKKQYVEQIKASINYPPAGSVVED